MPGFVPVSHDGPGSEKMNSWLLAWCLEGMSYQFVAQVSVHLVLCVTTLIRFRGSGLVLGW